MATKNRITPLKSGLSDAYPRDHGIHKIFPPGSGTPLSALLPASGEGAGGSFSDTRVFLCRPGDPRLARADWPVEGGFEQSENGPIYLVIGAKTDDDRCRRMGARFAQDPLDLMAFRDSAEVSHG